MGNYIESQKNTLSKVRGRFESRGIEKAEVMFGLSLFFIGPPIFLWFLIRDGIPDWPFDSEQWLLIFFAFLSLGMGVLMKNNLFMYYLFDGEYITAFKANGKEFIKIRISDIVSVKVSYSGGKVLELETKENHMNVIVSKDLQHALEEIESDHGDASTGESFKDS